MSDGGVDDGGVDDGEVVATLALGPLEAGTVATGTSGQLEVVGDDHGVHARLVVTGATGRRASSAGDGAVTALVEGWRAAGAAAEPVRTGAAGSLRAAWTGEAAGEPTPGLERQVSTDHANRSVATGQVLVKLLRHGVPDPERVLTPALHLRAVGFDRVPTLLGSLTWEPAEDERRSGPVLLALAHRYLADAEEGWGRFRDLAGAALGGPGLPGGPPGGPVPDDRTSPAPADPAPEGRDPVAELGALVAGFHVAMATPSPMLPTPETRSTPDDHRRWHREATALLTATCREVTGPVGAELRAGAERLRAALDPLAVADPPTPLLRIHGDLHVGQVLTADGRLYLTDLDGDPSAEPGAQGAPAPAARDIAAVLRSLDHVGRLAAHRLGSDRGTVPVAAVDAWITTARRTFLDAYRASLAVQGRPDLLDDRLVAPFEAAQVSHELRYATRWLPAWLPVATEAMRAWLEGRITGGR